MLGNRKISFAICELLQTTSFRELAPITSSATHSGFSLLLLPWGEAKGSQSRGTHFEGEKHSLHYERTTTLWQLCLPSLEPQPCPSALHPQRVWVPSNLQALGVTTACPACSVTSAPSSSRHVWAAAPRTSDQPLMPHVAQCTAVPPTTPPPLYSGTCQGKKS